MKLAIPVQVAPEKIHNEEAKLVTRLLQACDSNLVTILKRYNHLNFSVWVQYLTCFFGRGESDAFSPLFLTLPLSSFAELLGTASPDSCFGPIFSARKKNFARRSL